MKRLSLEEIVAEKPYTEYADWWPMGRYFLAFMSKAIHSSWQALYKNKQDLSEVATYVDRYIRTVYKREARPSLVDDFVKRRSSAAIQSGEFDALSYSFYKSSYEQLQRETLEPTTLALEQRQFTRQVGKSFFADMAVYLNLDLPARLDNEADVNQLIAEINRVGGFLKREGYLRDHFAYRIDVNIEYQGRRIEQTAVDFTKNLLQRKVVYALYEMGYPVIMPSAVYLFHTLGEAQHHSSRIMEELFEHVGCKAAETADFDPTGFPSEMVVELWEIIK